MILFQRSSEVPVPKPALLGARSVSFVASSTRVDKVKKFCPIFKKENFFAQGLFQLFLPIFSTKMKKKNSMSGELLVA